MEKETPPLIEKLGKLLGHKKLLGMVRMSRHPEDHYLWHVIYKNKEEYVCHVYNSQINGFVDGAYSKNEDKAWRTFFERLKKHHDLSVTL